MTSNKTPALSALVNEVREKLPDLASGYNGKAIILPSLAQIVETTGLTRNSFYRMPGGPDQCFSEASGLSVIAQNAIVLGKPENSTPYDPEFVEQALGEQRIEELAVEAETLSAEQRKALIARLAIHE